MVSFVVYGEPVAQGRPKTAVINGHAVVYDPAKSRQFKQLVARVAQDHAPGQLLTGPIILEVQVYRSIPKSFSRRKREDALAGVIRPTTKPDLKNYIAGVEDALEKIIYENDSQIVGYGDSGKWYGDPPRVEITVKEVVAGGLFAGARYDKQTWLYLIRRVYRNIEYYHGDFKKKLRERLGLGEKGNFMKATEKLDAGQLGELYLWLCVEIDLHSSSEEKLVKGWLSQCRSG